VNDSIEFRIPKLPREEWTDEAREVFAFWGEPNAWEEGSKTNIQMVLANHPKLGMAYSIWGKRLLMENALPMRHFEMIALRVGWCTKSAYEWHSHVGYALNLGMTLDEIAAIKMGPDAENWADDERAILTAVDQLLNGGDISDALWARLSGFYDRKQLMDLIFTTGHYAITSWAVTAMRMPIEPWIDPIGWDLKTRSGKTPKPAFKPGEIEDWAKKRDCGD
jgi:4-carboxymuconolactone decarboxylase